MISLGHPHLQRSWVGATKKQRDELLDFIRHLAEDDKEGVMATKVNQDMIWTCSWATSMTSLFKGTWALCALYFWQESPPLNQHKY